MKNSASQFMDKQIMNLSNPQSVIDGSGGGVTHGDESNFIDFVNRSSEKKEDILASYDFMPIRQALGSTSTAVGLSSDLDTGEVDTSRRTWNSFDSKTDAPSIRSYNVLDADESAKFGLQKNRNSDVPLNMSIVSEIDKLLKKNMENLTHSIDTMSARLSQLETRTRNLENSIDDLKLSVHNNHGSNEGRLRLLENILNEVRSDVGVIKDKQEILDGQLEIAHLRVRPLEKDESNNTALADPTQRVSANQQLGSFSPAKPPQASLPPPPAPNQNFLLQSQLPSRDSYFPSSSQTPEKPTQHYQVSAAQPQPQLQSTPFPQHPQYQSPPPPPQPQYPQQPPPPSQPPVSQPHQPFSAPNPSMLALPPPPQFAQHPEEAPYIPPNQTYPPGMHPPSSQPPSGAPPPQQPYGATPTAYYPSSMRPVPGFSGQFGPQAGAGEAYPNPYNSPPQPQYGNTGSSHMKPQQHTSAYPQQLPTARILPEALSMATPVSEAPSGGNKVPADDVVARVTAMGFPRDLVRATVRKLNDDGQAIDLNIVLDKLMNSGEVQAPRGWFGR